MYRGVGGGRKDGAWLDGLGSRVKESKGGKAGWGNWGERERTGQGLMDCECCKGEKKGQVWMDRRVR